MQGREIIEAEGRRDSGVSCRIVGYLSDCLSACFANCLCTEYTQSVVVVSVPQLSHVC